MFHCYNVFTLFWSQLYTDQVNSDQGGLSGQVRLSLGASTCHELLKCKFIVKLIIYDFEKISKSSLCD